MYTVTIFEYIFAQIDKKKITKIYILTTDIVYKF